jgi:ATP/maltotriose-dependent transcriptional regulator MalT
MEALAAQGDDAKRLQALQARWLNSLYAGRIDDAVVAADDGRGIYRADEHHALTFRYGNHDPCVCAMSVQALAFALRGESARAVSQLHDAIALGKSLGHAVSVAQPLTQLPWALQMNGDAGAALLASEQALLLEDEIVHPQFFGIAHAMRGWALSCLGRDEEGVGELERALSAELEASDMWAAMIASLLAESYDRQGRSEAARELLDYVRSLTKSKPPCVFEPQFLRVEAEWLARAGQHEKARQVLLEAIATADDHGSLALAIRAALALVRIPSPEHEADLALLDRLCARLPPENDTNYRREARLILDPSATTRSVRGHD